MFRPLLIAALAAASYASPALAAPVKVTDLERIQTIARQEGMPIKSIRIAGPMRLHVGSEGALNREAFIKRASLLAYYVYDRLGSPIEEIEFRNVQASGDQVCRIRAADYRLYLKDKITRAEYEKRIRYEVAGKAAVKPPVPLKPPAVPPVSLPVPQAPQPVAAPVVPAAPVLPVVRTEPPAPVAPGWAPMFGFAYGVRMNGGSYDAYHLEYGHPVLKTLDVRPGLQIISAFSPINFTTPSPRPLEGLAAGVDLLGTTRQAPNAAGVSFDGGLGARLATLQGSAGKGELWPAMYLRLGVRWHLLAIGMRYPLLHRTGDPTSGWEGSFGLSMPLN